MIVHLTLVVLNTVLFWLLLMRAMPAVHVKRGRVQSWGVLMLAVVCALSMGGSLQQLLAHGRVYPMLAVRDFAIVGVAVIEVLRARKLGPFRWDKCPQEVESGHA